MRRLFYIISLLFTAINTIAQHDPTKEPCDFLKGLKFKKGVDTIVIKARYQSISKSADYSLLKILDKQKRLNYNEFGVDTGEEDASAALEFTVDGCPANYFGTISRKIYNNSLNKIHHVNIDTLKHEQIIYLSCEVFEGKIMGVDHFFVITDINTKPSDYDRYPPIKNKAMLDPITTPISADPNNILFSFHDWPLATKFYILAIDKHHYAIIKYNGSYLYLKKRSKTLNGSGFTIVYANSHYKLLLTIKGSGKLRAGRTVRNGIVEIQSGKSIIIKFPVHAIAGAMQLYE